MFHLKSELIDENGNVKEPACGQIDERGIHDIRHHELLGAETYCDG